MTTETITNVDLWANEPAPEPIDVKLGARVLADAIDLQETAYQLRIDRKLPITRERRRKLAEPPERLADQLWIRAGRILGELP